MAKVSELDVEFSTLLDDASFGAVTEWEIDFCSDMQERWMQYEDDMFVSEKQLEVLKRLSERTNSKGR